MLEIFDFHRATGTPIVCGKATDVLSWHMLEVPGRLLLPYIREKLIHVRGFEPGAARGVEDDRFRGEGLHLGANAGKGIDPGDRHVLSLTGSQRIGSVSRPTSSNWRSDQLSSWVTVCSAKKDGRASFFCYFPGGGFCAVLAEFERAEMWRTTIGATDTGKTAGLY